MNTLKKNGATILLSITVIGLIVFMVSQPKQPKMAYVDNIELFNGFNFKKEKQAEYDAHKKQFEAKLDTIRLNHTAIENALRQNPNNRDLEARLAYSYQYYQQVDRQLGLKLDSLDNGFKNEAWTKLNSYVTEFGKKNGYDIIIGASGNGSLMYGNETFNITEEVIEYANNRYEGNE